MKILWCTHSLSGFDVEAGGYNGCGWITSLLEEFKKDPSVEIGVAFYYHKQTEAVVRNGVTFFPMYQGRVGIIGKLKTFFGDYSAWITEESAHIVELNDVVGQYEPDVIHVWGTETEMGLIANMVEIPVIVHLQGLLNPYKNSLLPPGFSKWNYICKDGYNPIKMLKNYNGLKYWEYKAERETRILKTCKHYFGRTHWDKALSKLYNPFRSYHFCSEMLRPEFYLGEKWSVPRECKVRVISTISAPFYKGMDMVLKTANILKDYTGLDFEWLVIGVTQARNAEKVTGIKADSVNVKCVGVKTAGEIKELELHSHIYFHPSYIDNSPNSICEAQMLGMPIVAVNVGGVASILDNGKLGKLVPSNEPHMAAALIVSLLGCVDELPEMSEMIRSKAAARHNKNSIIKSLQQGYREILCK